jgi:hypothetical protein
VIYDPNDPYKNQYDVDNGEKEPIIQPASRALIHYSYDRHHSSGLVSQRIDGSNNSRVSEHSVVPSGV